MTDKTDPNLSGEEREKRRRRKFWRYFTIAMVLSAVAGLMSGFVSQSYLDGELDLSVPIAALIVVVAGLTWFCIDFYRRVDELDLMDNLWAHLIGVNVGVVVTGIWWFLADIELVSMPTAVEAVLVILTAIFASYCLRKLGLR